MNTVRYEIDQIYDRVKNGILANLTSFYRVVQEICYNWHAMTARSIKESWFVQVFRGTLEDFHTQTVINIDVGPIAAKLLIIDHVDDL